MIASESPNAKSQAAKSNSATTGVKTIPSDADAQVADIERLEQLLLQAVTLHQAGNLDTAAHLYREVLKSLPTQPNANHNLGVIALEANDVDASLELFKTALEVAPEDPQYWISYIEALLQAKQYDYAGQVLAHGIEGGLEGDEVESLKRRLADAQAVSPPVENLEENSGAPIASKPEKSLHQTSVKAKKNGKPSFDEMNTLVSAFNQGRMAESEQQATWLTQRYPRHGFGWKVLGAIRQQQGRQDEAFHAFKMAAEFLPDDSEAHYNLGNYFYDQNQLAQAAACYQKAVRIEPGFAKAHYNLGSVLKDQGKFGEAETSYKKALKITPDNAQMHSNLGAMLNEQGRFDEAKSYFLRTLELDPSFVDAYCSLSVIDQQAGLTDAAEASLRKAIAIKPDFASAHYNLANRLLEQGRLAEAEQSYLSALAIDPQLSGAHNNLGTLFKEQGKLTEAEVCYRKAIVIAPDYAGAYNNLGITLREQGRFAEAETSYRSALELNPSSPEALNNLGIALKDQGLLAEAEAIFQQALAIKPNYAEANCNLGITFEAQGRFAEAEHCLRLALEVRPDFAEAYSNLGIVFKDQGRLEESEHNYLLALQIKPDYFEAYSNLGSTYKDQGRLLDAERCFRKALEIKPAYYQAFSNLLFCLTHNAEVDAAALAAEHRRFGEQYESPLKKYWPQFNNSKDPQRCLRVGFVSGDLRNHAVAFFIEPVLERLAEYPSLSLHAYATSTVHDEVSKRLNKHFAAWTQVATLSANNLAEKIYADGIDILIDLSGHTAGHRLITFAYKPAPLQASWIGYPGSTGLTGMDYFLADRFLLPSGQFDDQFTEKLVQLPAGASFQPVEVSPPINTLPALGNGFVTFGSFNRPSKLSPAVIALWSQVLKALPDSRLLLGAMQQDGNNETLLDWFAQEGIAPERLILHARSDMANYLALHQQVDICLDTFPYNGGTTTWHAMWMGVPTLSLAGDTLPSRIGVAIMGHVGLSDFVVSSKDEFLQKAVYWANNLDALAKLRTSMRTRFSHSAVGRPDIIAQGLESALRTMWQRWCQDAPAASFEVTLPEGTLSAYDGGDAVTDSAAELVQLPAHVTEKNTELQLATTVAIVSATRLSESEFWSKSALGLSLKKLLEQDANLTANIAFENSRGLPEVFNDCIAQADENAVLVFMHDDVWIDQPNFSEAILAGLEQFDVIGVAGNRRRLVNQPAWNFADIQFAWDDASNLSGCVAHGENALGAVLEFGAVPAECELLDGVFLAAKACSLKQHGVRFDPQFDFHFYDMDFCRSVRKAGLKLGTWPISLTHQSEGAFGSQHWRKKYECYLDKWDAATKHEVADYLDETTQKEQDLQQAVDEVLQLAIQHHQAGEDELATQLYQEIIKIQPRHAEANYSLGVLLAHASGIQDAVPHFELAVHAAPEHEQYWVSYIDALVLSGAAGAAITALELGQQYGLKPETAQMLKTEFEADLETGLKQEQAQLAELQQSVMEAMQVALTPSNKRPTSGAGNRATAKPVIYIWAFDYSEFSSGIKSLHLLCDRLNQLGYESYVTAANTAKNLNAPYLTEQLKQQHTREGRLQIALYPEVEPGNPIGVPNVVRYLLNQPNKFLKTSWFGSFHQDEQVLHYDDSFAVPWVESQGVRIQTVNRNLYQPLAELPERSGFLVYSHRVKPDMELIPAWCQPFQVISMDKPRQPEQLASLYQQSAGMIVFERTAAALEAMLCGCPVMFCSHYGLDKSTVFYDGYHDFAWDFDQAAFQQAQQSLGKLADVYDANSVADTQALKVAMDNIISRFRKHEPDVLETTPACALAAAKQYAQQGDMRAAVLAYRQLIIDHPDYVETYYRMAEALAKTGLAKSAQDTLLKGEPYLTQLPQHACLDAVRTIYAQKLTEINS